MTEDRENSGNRIDVAYVARLARIELTDGEIEVFGRQLREVVGYFDQIRRLDVGGVEPTAHAVPLDNVFREDEPADSGLDRRDTAANAPVWRNGAFMVPRIIE